MYVSFVRYSVKAILCSATAFLLLGCADTGNSQQPTTRPLTFQERQDAALKDPFSYGNQQEPPVSISGGGVGHLDKSALKHDVDTVMNP